MDNKLLIVTIFLLCSSVASADTSKVNLSVGLSYDYTDNIFLSSNFVVPENIYHALLDASYRKKTANMDLDFSLNLDRQKYQKYSYFDNTTGSSRLTFAGALSKNLLYWDVEDRFDKVPNAFNSPNLPSNYQNINYFLAGPRLLLINDSRNSLITTAKYQKFYAESSPTDYAGPVLNLSYTRKVTRLLSVGLTSKYNEVNYDNKLLNTDYSRTDISVNIQKRLKHSELTLEVGKTKIIPAVTNSEGTLFRASYSLQAGERTKLSIEYQKELSDFSNVFSNTSSQNQNLPDVGNSIFVLTAGNVLLQRKFGLSDLSFNYSYFKNDYSNDVQNVISNQSSIIFNNQVSPAVKLNLNASYQHINYPGTGLLVKEKIYSAGLTRKFTNLYTLGMRIQYLNRDSSDNLSGFTERRINVNAHYFFR